MKTILLSAAILAVISFVGSESYDAALEQEREYCAAVREGLWPDYKSIYDRACNGD